MRRDANVPCKRRTNIVYAVLILAGRWKAFLRSWQGTKFNNRRQQVADFHFQYYQDLSIHHLNEVATEISQIDCITE